MSKIEALLIKDEGLKTKPYKDTVGKLTIGIGRNLDDVGLSQEECLYLLKNDLNKVETELSKFPWFKLLNEARKDVLRNMCFNLGINRLLGFVNFISALSRQDYSQAAKEMLDSKWSTQVKGRAVYLAKMMETGDYCS